MILQLQKKFQFNSVCTRRGNTQFGQLVMSVQMTGSFEKVRTLNLQKRCVLEALEAPDHYKVSGV